MALLPFGLGRTDMDGEGDLKNRLQKLSHDSNEKLTYSGWLWTAL